MTQFHAISPADYFLSHDTEFLADVKELIVVIDQRVLLV